MTQWHKRLMPNNSHSLNRWKNTSNVQRMPPNYTPSLHTPPWWWWWVIRGLWGNCNQASIKHQIKMKIIGGASDPIQWNPCHSNQTLHTLRNCGRARARPFEKHDCSWWLPNNNILYVTRRSFIGWAAQRCRGSQGKSRKQEPQA